MKKLIEKVKETVSRELSVPYECVDNIHIFPVVLDGYLRGDCIVEYTDLEEIEFRIDHNKQVEIVDRRPLNEYDEY